MKIRYLLTSLILPSVVLITACSQATTQTTSTPVSVTSTTTTSNVPTITAPDAYNLIQQNISNPNFIIIDVRTADEFNSGHIAGAINIDYESAQFTADVSLLDKTNQYLVYCKTGIRGAAATQIMVGLGFINVQNIAGGITAWIQDGYPVTAPVTTQSTTSSPTVTTTSTTTQPSTTTPLTTTVQSMNGLQLQISINATSLTPGEPLQIAISEYNALSTGNNVAAATNWKVNGLTIGACPNINMLPFGVAVFQGSYNDQNISQGTPLKLFGAVPCPQLMRLITGYDFLPNSNNAAIMPGGDIATPTPMATTETVNGTYSQGFQLTPFPTGTYTVVAGDEWGTLEFLYFTVE
jgi:rhodanese-related sulfurtransferase